MQILSLIIYDEAHKILHLPVFGALHCSHHGMAGEPCRILLVLIHAKDDIVLLRHVCHSSFLHTGLFFKKM